MTPLARFFRDAVEKLTGRYYEGPTCPKRLVELVDAFRAAYPAAGPLEWERFARNAVAIGYREGYTRGWEATARDPDAQSFRHLPPELLADAEDPDWRRVPIRGDLENPYDELAEEFEPGEIRPRGMGGEHERDDGD